MANKHIKRFSASKDIFAPITLSKIKRPIISEIAEEKREETATVGGNVYSHGLPRRQFGRLYQNQRWANQTLNQQVHYCEFILQKHL